MLHHRPLDKLHRPILLCGSNHPATTLRTRVAPCSWWSCFLSRPVELIWLIEAFSTGQCRYSHASLFRRWNSDDPLFLRFLDMTLNCIHIFIVTGSFLYWCVMRPRRPVSVSSCTASCIYLRLRILIISYLATFLGTNRACFTPGSFYDRIISFRAPCNDVTMLSWYEASSYLF